MERSVSQREPGFFLALRDHHTGFSRCQILLAKIYIPCLFIRTLIHGDIKAGFTVFWADDGLDTGPILLQRECDVGLNDTVDDLYNRFLFPEGIKSMVS